MRTINARAVEDALGYPDLIDVLEQAFRIGAVSPLRHHHTIALDGRPEATLLLMPAWTKGAADVETAGRYAGIKLVTVFPDNGELYGRPAIDGIYLLLSAENGQPLALIDGPKLTVWRTAAASALAARYLAASAASRLLVVGAGALAPYLVRAHVSVRPIKDVAIWNRTEPNAQRVIAELARHGIAATLAPELEAAVRQADIVSTATISSTPLIEGAWLKPGTHLDCVGAFRPDMRETDDECIRRARLWVDTMSGGTSEAGDVVIPLKTGLIAEKDIQGDLFALARGTAPLRRADDEITMFKSVGASIEDLAAAIAVYESTGKA
jgi:ornithine cyclodeaminase/alanine dehydrogenase-like protein (mu-crystallin family)